MNNSNSNNVCLATDIDEKLSTLARANLDGISKLPIVFPFDLNMFWEKLLSLTRASVVSKLKNKREKRAMKQLDGLKKQLESSEKQGISQNRIY